MFVYGHGSWVALIPLLAIVVARVLVVSRRGGRGRGYPRSGPMPGNPFTGVSRRGDLFGGPAARPPDVAGPPGPGGSTVGGTAPGWFVDPFFKHHHRYWSGTEWTEHVSDDGVAGTDPPLAPSPRHGPTE